MRRLLAILLVMFAFAAAAQAAPVREARRLDDGSDTTQTLTLAGVADTSSTGLWLRSLQVDVTGAGTVTFALTSRVCGYESSGATTCGAWEPSALASGSITAGSPTPGTVTLELQHPRYQYRLTLTVTSGAPTALRVWGLYQ